MKILVCGDRDWDDEETIRYYLRQFKDYDAIIVIDGAARGADSMGYAIACELDYHTERYPANWDKYHKAAGAIRNKQMLTMGKPDLVLAFHNDIDHSKGTKHMVTIAREADIPTLVITSMGIES